MKSETSKLKVFVYGTLKPGGVNYDRYCRGLVESQTPAYIRGILYDLPVGYPAAIEASDRIRGVLLTFKDPNALNNLDVLEDYQPQREDRLNLYYRRMVNVYSLDNVLLGETWVYFMNPEKVRELGGTLLDSGWWETALKD